MAAMRAHATQIDVDGRFFALSNNLGSQAFGIEHFRRVRGPGAAAAETDLFAGLDLIAPSSRSGTVRDTWAGRATPDE